MLSKGYLTYGRDRRLLAPSTHVYGSFVQWWYTSCHDVLLVDSLVCEGMVQCLRSTVVEQSAQWLTSQMMRKCIMFVCVSDGRD